jgi:hypothetical protein
MTSEELHEIERMQEAVNNQQPIFLSDMKGWTNNSSLEVRGVAVGLISDHSHRVHPPLSMQEIFEFCLKFYEDCILQDISSLYCPGKYIAGMELANWFKTLWDDMSVPREYLIQLKQMIRGLYEKHERLRDALINGALEHVFEYSDIQEFFSDWKSDGLLSGAFAQAKEWGDDHLK